MEEKKNNNLRLIIGIGAIASLMSFAFVCGLFYGSFQSTLGFVNYMNEYEDEILKEFNQTCEDEEIINDLKNEEYTCLSYYKGGDYSNDKFQALKKECNSEGFCKDIFYNWDNNFERIYN